MVRLLRRAAEPRTLAVDVPEIAGRAMLRVCRLFTCMFKPVQRRRTNSSGHKRGQEE